MLDSPHAWLTSCLTHLMLDSPHAWLTSLLIYHSSLPDDPSRLISTSCVFFPFCDALFAWFLASCVFYISFISSCLVPVFMHPFLMPWCLLHAPFSHALMSASCTLFSCLDACFMHPFLMPWCLLYLTSRLSWLLFFLCMLLWLSSCFLMPWCVSLSSCLLSLAHFMLRDVPILHVYPLTCHPPSPLFLIPHVMLFRYVFSAFRSLCLIIPHFLCLSFFFSLQRKALLFMTDDLSSPSCLGVCFLSCLELFVVT